MNNKLISSSKGYTLLELIIVIGLLGLVITAGYSFYLIGVRNYNTTASKIDTQQNIRYSMEYITKMLLSASEQQIVVTNNPNAPDELKVNKTVFKVDGTTMKISFDSYNFNPLAEGIIDFKVNRSQDNMLSITIVSDNDLKLSTDIYCDDARKK